MLILTRRIGEVLMIGDNVTITVLGIKGNQVRIGTTAPMDVPVHREEIYNKIQREKAEAAGETVSTPDPEPEAQSQSVSIQPRYRKRNAYIPPAKPAEISEEFKEVELVNGNL